MQSAVESARKFSFYRYSGTAANLLWTIGWVSATDLAVLRLRHTGKLVDSLDAVACLLFAAFGCIVTVRAFPGKNSPPKPTKIYPKESLVRRITGALASVVWCGVGVLWNAAIFKWLIDSANDGNTRNIFIMIPFSLIGWFLLMVVTVMITMTLDLFVEMIRNSVADSVKNHSPADGPHPP